LGRIDYTIVDVDELEYLAQQAQVSRAQLAMVEFDDIPQGNSRFIMCSRKVDDATIARINAAIKAIDAAAAK
jgi:polar amino acid transport system substrate-binding protein